MLNTSPPKIVLCHPFILLREALTQLLTTGIDCEIVGTFARPVEAILKATDVNADILIVDWTYLEAKQCLAALKKKREPAMLTRVLVIADSTQSQLIAQRKIVGIDAYVLNTGSAQLLFSAIRHLTCKALRLSVSERHSWKVVSPAASGSTVGGS
jgi:DNA-binding NarL/FixJ family response regulator